MIQIAKACIISFILLSVGTVISSPTEQLALQEIPKKKFVGKLKGVAYATIRTSIIKEYKFTEPKEIRYVPCSPEFPKLPGDFPCSLLTWDEDSIVVDETTAVSDTESLGTEPSVDDQLGGKVIVLMSKVKSPNLEGSVIKLGEDEDTLKLFYDKEGHLSHYTFQSSVIIFKWKTIEKKKTLVGVMNLKLDSSYFPVSGKEIDFSSL
jgi:hypothetical protein